METTESQGEPDAAPAQRTKGDFIGLYLMGLLVSFVLMVISWPIFIVVYYIVYGLFLVVCIVLISLPRTRPFALGMLTAEIMFCALVIILSIYVFRYWNMNSMHF